MTGASGGSRSALRGAPKTGKVSKKTQALFDKVISDRDKVTEIEKSLASSEYYDPGCPRTRERRKMVRAVYEMTCQKLYNYTEHEQFWQLDGLTDRQKRYLAYYAAAAEGQLGTTVKVGSLYEAKYALYWWNATFVEGFGPLYHKWHVDMMRYIHQLATENNMTTASRPKNFLSSNELLMLYRVVMDANTGVDNLKQHYAAWLLSWCTGTRPGSITVGKGYGKNDELTTGLPRGVDETLRWSDIEWVKNENGQVCFKLTLKFLKLHRDQYKEDMQMEAARSFFFSPLKTAPMELDLTLILLGNAIVRGLFPGGLGYVLTTEDQYLKTNASVAAEPVFVRLDASGQLSKDAMHADSLNTKLREALVEAGLPSYCTMYSFRREAIRSTKISEGTEVAKDLANHEPDSNAISYYDTIGLGDVDIQAMRTRTEGMSREDAWTLLNPVRNSAYTKHSNSFKDNLRKERDSRVEEKVRKHPEMLEIGRDLKVHIDLTRQFLNEHFSGNSNDIPFGYDRTVTTRFKELLQEVVGEDAEEQHEYHIKFHELSSIRKATAKKLRKKFRSEELSNIADEMRSLRKISRKAATRGVRVGGGASKEVTKETAGGVHEIDRTADDQLAALNEIRAEDAAEDDGAEIDQVSGFDGTEEDDLEDGLDVEAIDAFTKDQNSRMGPLAWEDGVELERIDIEDGFDKDDPQYKEHNEDSRADFLKKWVNKTSIPSSGLQCPLCLLSPFATQAHKDKRYPRAQLERHLKSDMHDPLKGIRAAANDVVAAGGKPDCPSCSRHYEDAGALVKHVKEKHMQLVTGIGSSKSSSKRRAKKSKEIIAEDYDEEPEDGDYEEAGPSKPSQRARPTYVFGVDEDAVLGDAVATGASDFDSAGEESEEGSEEVISEDEPAPVSSKGKGKAKA